MTFTPTQFFKRLRSGLPQDPVRDWMVLITLSTLILPSIVVWSAWVFDTVAGGGTLSAPVSRSKSTLDQSSLEAIRTVFDTRAGEKAKYVTGIYHFTDPSQ